MKYVGDSVTAMLEKEGIDVDNELLESLLLKHQVGVMVPYFAQDKDELDKIAVKIYEEMRSQTKG